MFIAGKGLDNLNLENFCKIYWKVRIHQELGGRFDTSDDEYKKDPKTETPCKRTKKKKEEERREKQNPLEETKEESKSRRKTVITIENECSSSF